MGFWLLYWERVLQGLMNYLVAVLPDRIQAKAAYSALEKAGLPTSQVNILGDGYLSADEFGLIDPNKQASKQSTRLFWWLCVLRPFEAENIQGYTDYLQNSKLVGKEMGK